VNRASLDFNFYKTGISGENTSSGAVGRSMGHPQLLETGSRFYTGVGSSRTPPDICALIISLAQYLATTGMILRTGANKGADQAFAAGTAEQREVYSPYTDAGGYSNGIVITDRDIAEQAVRIAAQLHPGWKDYNDFARKAHTRCIYQVLGADLQTPSAYVICYASVDDHGQIEGSTRTTVALAQARSIPVYNLHDLSTRSKFRKRLEEIALQQTQMANL
jgi:hypothetical protein